MSHHNALSDIIAQAVSLSGLGSFLLENSFINLSGVLVCAPVRKKSYNDLTICIIIHLNMVRNA